MLAGLCAFCSCILFLGSRVRALLLLAGNDAQGSLTLRGRKAALRPLFECSFHCGDLVCCIMRPAFILFGDSITQQSFSPAGGWGAALANRYARKADVILRGYSGYNTRWALFLLEKIFPNASASDPPLLVTVFFGANDASLPDRDSKNQYVPILEYKDNLKKIVAHVKGISERTLVVLITPPPVFEEDLRTKAWKQWGLDPESPSTRSNDVTGTYSKACIDAAKEVGVPFIDLWSNMQKDENWQKIYLSDGLHLSPVGNGFLFEKLLDVLDANDLSFDELKWDFPEHFNINPENPKDSFKQFKI